MLERIGWLLGRDCFPCSEAGWLSLGDSLEGKYVWGCHESIVVEASMSCESRRLISRGQKLDHCRVDARLCYEFL